MNRRTALMASIAVMGAVIRTRTERQVIGTVDRIPWQMPDTLKINLGGHDGYTRFVFTDGKDTVTFMAAELMSALKG